MGLKQSKTLFTCPICKKDFPLLLFNEIKTSYIDLTVKCSCLSVPIVINLIEFLTKLKEPIEIEYEKSNINNNQVGIINCRLCNSTNEQHKKNCHYKQYPNYSLSIKCIEHDNDYIAYCEDCDINICNLCLGHNEHSLHYPNDELYNTYKYIPGMSQIKETQEKVSKYFNNLESIVFKESENTKLKQLKNCIMSLFDISTNPMLPYIIELWDSLNYTLSQLTELNSQQYFEIGMHYNLIQVFKKKKMHKPFLIFHELSLIDYIQKTMSKQSDKVLIDNHFNEINDTTRTIIIYIIHIEEQDILITITLDNVIKTWDLLTLQSKEKIYIKNKTSKYLRNFAYTSCLTLNDEQIVYLLKTDEFSYNDSLLFININPLKCNAEININTNHKGIFQLHNNQVAVYYKDMTIVFYDTKTYQITSRFNMQGIYYGYCFLIDVFKTSFIRIIIPEISFIYYINCSTLQPIINIEQRRHITIKRQVKAKYYECYKILPLKNETKIAFWFQKPTLLLWDTQADIMYTKTHFSFITFKTLIELENDIIVTLSGYPTTIIFWNFLTNQYLHIFTEFFSIRNIFVLNNGNLRYYDDYHVLEFDVITYERKLLDIESQEINNCIQLKDERVIVNLKKTMRIDKLHFLDI